MRFGIYRLDEPIGASDLASIENEYRTDIHIVSVYRAWNHCDIKDDLPWLERLKSIPRDLLLTWEPWIIPPDTKRPFDQPDFSLRHIISGRYDVYIRAFARELADFPQTLYLRPMHEMNGNWYPWCGTVNDNSPESFIPAWNHIRDLVGDEVSSDVEFVWSPYTHSYPDDPVNDPEKYFPGDNALDWMAIDGYNWGESMEWSEWQSFEKIFSKSYRKLTELSNRPIMIGEVASDEKGGSKELWIGEMFGTLKERFQRIDAIIWFDENKECDWRIRSSAGSLRSFRAGAGLFKAEKNR